MPAGQQGDHDLLNDFLLANDDSPQFVANTLVRGVAFSNCLLVCLGWRVIQGINLKKSCENRIGTRLPRTIRLQDLVAIAATRPLPRDVSQREGF